MLTDTRGEFPHQFLRPHWPQEFSIRRREFDRKAENQTYIEWLRDNFTDGDSAEDEEEDEEDEGQDEDDKVEDEDEDNSDSEEDEFYDAEELYVEIEDKFGADGDQHENENESQNDKSTEVFKEHEIGRIFMKGMTGDEKFLQWRDQVDVVASFVEQSRSGESKKLVALLLDDGECGSANPAKRKPCRLHQGPLTSQQLRELLSKRVSLISRLHYISGTLIRYIAFQSQVRPERPTRWI
jgi:hypothetical protein